ncbi:hypothetical protein I317_01119 [Kwoniella heveanensis CBS 569]|nr:hypothetical protein I317_01119 [Kwoniella heveanensis CBS 569]
MSPSFPLETPSDSASQPFASSSRHTLSPAPIITSTPLLSRRLPRYLRRRLHKSTLFFVAALCLPLLASANPLPPLLAVDSDFRHRSRAPSPGVADVHHIMSAARQMASDFLARRSNQTDGPVLDIASYDPILQTYRVPDGYVRLNQVFNPGFIVLSYVIAFVGSLCTLELLIRRTTNSGWRNQLLLTSAGFCFGAVSTFAMHFVFNNALSLHHPMMDQKSYPALYLSYDPGFTILSLVVSCLAMTMAFFVMGTRLKDWLILPGQRRKDQMKRRGSPTKAEADDYGRWKKSHQKIVRRGTMGVGALFNQAGQAAKWSLMDSEQAPRRTSLKEKLSGIGKDMGWKEEAQGLYSPRTAENDDIIGDDEALKELDFRFGKDAVRMELERRAGASTPTSTISRPPSIINPNGSHGHLATPLPVIYASSSRRGSTTSNPAEPTSHVFTPGFDFPPKVEPDYNAMPNFFRSSGSSSALPLQDLSSAAGTESLPTYHSDRRRASLPNNMLVAHRDRPSYSGPSSTLARIQSLPEGDLEPATTSSQHSKRSSYEAKNAVEVTPRSIIARLGSYNSRSDQHSERTKKVRLVGRTTRWTRIGMFLGLDVVTFTEVLKILITGTIAGCGVAGMHYIGQASITGLPYIAYTPSYVVGSIIIACGAVIIALYIMFIMLRPKLKHTWFSKICVALILAVAVTCMHFCGMMGTLYAWPVGRGISRHSKLTGTNVVITGIVAALAFSACIACAIFFLLHSLNQRRERARRRRVVVAAVLLDDRDRVLVNSLDGTLPMCDIASLTGGDVPDSKRSFNHSVSSDSTVLGMDLSTGHDAFVSALKLSWTWKNPSLAPIQPVISTDATKSHTSESVLAASLADIRRGSMITNNTTSATTNSRPPVSLTKFLERFTVSSSQLAVRLLGQADGISRLGVLYDQILTTGWVKLHNSNDTVSKGQLIFLVRRVLSAVERADLESRHFIFADPQAVATTLHKTLSVPFEHTMPLLDDMRGFCDSTLQTRLQPGKLYAGVAVVQATPFDGLRILLEKDMRSQLPMREVCSLGLPSSDDDVLSGTVEEIGEAVALLEGMTILSIISRNMTAGTEQMLSKRVVNLLSALERAIVPMLDEMLTAEDMEHILPRLTLHPMLIPLTPGGTKRAVSSYIPPYAVIFYANYDAAVNTFTDKWLPFSLFRAQNACVMAPKITAAAKMDQLYTAETSESGSSYPPQRRPSKVQFDFPHSHIHSREQTPLASPQPQHADEVGTATMFGGFTFPPKSAEAEENRSDSGHAHGHNQGGHSRQSSLQAISAVHRAGSSRIPHGHGSSSNTGANNGPRRSSLARSRFGSIGGDSLAPSAEAGAGNNTYGYGYGHGHASLGSVAGSGREMTPLRPASVGVAVWEQDWLLRLLRMKLRADA